MSSRSSSCCDLYFSEWKRESNWKIIFGKGVLVLFLTAVLLFHANLDQIIIDSSRITYETLLASLIWSLLTGMLFVIYVPSQHKIFPLWWEVGITVCFALVAIFFVIAFLWLDLFPYIPADTMAVDLWSIVHLLWGVWLSWLLPFVWMLLDICSWEVLEAFTSGLGESEGIANHTVDVVLAMVGYLVVVLLFTATDIPWITAKRGVHCRTNKKLAVDPQDDQSDASRAEENALLSP